jgi:hypothetical protein
MNTCKVADAVPSNALQGPIKRGSSLRERLEATFFRQHPQVQRAAEFTLQSVMRNGLAMALSSCVEPAVQQTEGAALNDACAFALATQEAAQAAAGHARRLIVELYEQRVPACLELLSAPAVHPSVIDMAAQLTIQHALNEGIGEWLSPQCSERSGVVDFLKLLALRL